MSWYLARLLMRSSIDYEQSPLFLEEFVLIRADSYDGAYGKAGAKGLAMEHCYPNNQGVEVRWTLQCILEIRQLIDEQIVDGTEIYAKAISEPPEIVPKSSIYE